MKKIIRSLFAVMAIIFSVTLTVRADSDLPKPGEILSGSYPVIEEGLFGKKLLRSIPLPEGDWIVVNAWDKQSVNNAFAKQNPIKLRDMVLVQVDSRKNILAAIYLTTNLESRAYKWDTEYCKDTSNNFIYSNNYGGGIQAQRCTFIKTTTYLASSTAGQNSVREFYNVRGFRYDPITVMVQNSEYDQNGNFLRIDYFYFPSTQGLENPASANVTSSPWFKSNYKTDPQKVKFIEGLEVWANQNSDLLNRYFGGSDKRVEQIPLYKYKPN